MLCYSTYVKSEKEKLPFEKFQGIQIFKKFLSLFCLIYCSGLYSDVTHQFYSLCCTQVVKTELTAIKGLIHNNENEMYYNEVMQKIPMLQHTIFCSRIILK